ncbi:hypothetical protein MMC25_000005 [Agyrium rufum]|nr:hypothetical protein [Agyrium rufum]
MADFKSEENPFAEPVASSSASSSSASSSDEKKKQRPTITIRSRTDSASSSSSLSIKTPRIARFAEATSVNSPIGPTLAGRNPFAGAPIITTRHLAPVAQPSDIGFGYVSASEREKHTSIEVPLTPMSPLRSALKPPGTPGRFLDPRSPTFHEEVNLEKAEESTDKQNATDLKVKIRVRMAKMMLRGVNFSCSLIVLSMLSATFTIFNATKDIPPRSSLPPWAPSQKIWPQVTLLVIACVSLFLSLCVFYAYWKGGHRRAQKAAVYYTMFAFGFFAFNTVMWIIAAAVLHGSKANGNGKDMWGWSCNKNTRATLFQDEVNYALVCRLQNWGLICALIEILVEIITITIYGVVAYRIFSKRRLHKSMNNRERARSDLYLAQLRSQSAPNTPGFAAKNSAVVSSFPKELHDDDNDDDQITTTAGESTIEYYNKSIDAHTQFVDRRVSFSRPGKPTFQLQAPPVRVQHATPILEQPEHFDSFPPPQQHQQQQRMSTASPPPPQPSERVIEHMDAAPGEQTYEAVPIPGANYLQSPRREPQGGFASLMAQGQAPR